MIASEYRSLSVVFEGMGGSGRQSAAKLATFMADYFLFQIEITRNYTNAEWRDDLKKVVLIFTNYISIEYHVFDLMFKLFFSNLFIRLFCLVLK
jgi:hypothetical protein